MVPNEFPERMLRKQKTKQWKVFDRIEIAEDNKKATKIFLAAPTPLFASQIIFMD
jgi:hypothetical protein